MTKLVNLTPHPLVLCRADETPITTIPPSGIVARVKAERRVLERIPVDDDYVPLTTQVLGELQGLPGPEDGTWYITSFIAAQAAACLGRTDVLVTDDAVRDPSGKIIGCRALSRI